MRDFSKLLLRWHATCHREMPWKQRQDAYAIWLSEVILQQTRVAQGLPYYQKFIEQFPTVRDLAQAAEQEVLRLWQGLGYYSRARHLHETARYVANQLGGEFPSKYQELLRLKGVGPYTAAAIASFAFGEVRPVVDGNVFRVLSRYFGDETDIAASRGRNHFTALALQLIDKHHPGDFNQAMMDLGATVCKPVNPLCEACPFRKNCKALAQNRIELLPVNSKKIKRRERYFYFLVFRTSEQIGIRQRTGNDIWKSLYEFPYFEAGSSLSGAALKARLRKKGIEEATEVIGFTQHLTHQTIKGRFFEVKKGTAPEDLDRVPIEALSQYAFPKILLQYMNYCGLLESSE